MVTLKNNVSQFNKDINDEGGYEYTSETRYSAKVANDRLTRATIECINEIQVTKNIAKAIDLGCGDGTYTAQLKEYYRAISFIGIDPAVEAIKRAKSLFPNIAFYEGNLLEPNGFKDKIHDADLVILRGVLHHVSEPDRALQNVSKMAPYLILIEPNGLNPILKLIERFSSYHIAHEERSFTPFKIDQWLKNSGYFVVYRKYIGFVPFFFPELFAKVIYSIQPLLEKLPFIRHLFSACQVVVCKRERI